MKNCYFCHRPVTVDVTHEYATILLPCSYEPDVEYAHPTCLESAVRWFVEEQHWSLEPRPLVRKAGS